jgi:hypothetical protein
MMGVVEAVYQAFMPEWTAFFAVFFALLFAGSRGYRPGYTTDVPEREAAQTSVPQTRVPEMLSSIHIPI